MIQECAKLEINKVICGDNLEFLRSLPDKCVDLVFGSPPYEAARTYGIDFTLRGQDWVDWCVERYVECVRVCRGLVAWVVEGQTRKFRYSAVPALLMADLHRRGICLRKPPAFSRVGIPGSGGPDWLRNDYEFIVCASHGKLPWSDNTAMGHPPKWAPGGEMSHRLTDGTRRNQWGSSTNGRSTRTRNIDGVMSEPKPRPSHVVVTKRTTSNTVGSRKSRENADRLTLGRNAKGEMEIQGYTAPTKANPGNVIECIVGGGVMGNKMCHENEAPFPEKLAEFFIRSFCPPMGIVLDPFSGSGTTASVAVQTGRLYVAIDVRESQVELTKRRLGSTQRELVG